MRCPKCGYISFDHLENCLKCKKNILATSESLQGSVYNVLPPAYLAFANKQAEEVEIDQAEAFIEDDAPIDEFADIEDPDLDILVDEEPTQESEETEISLFSDEEGSDITLDMDDDAGGEESGLGLVADEDDGNLFAEEEPADDGELVDFAGSDFDDEEFESLGDEGPVAPELPDELSDISDLESPEVKEAVTAEATATDEADLDLDLDLGAKAADDLDLDESLTENADILAAAGAVEQQPASAAMDMDDDLDFDLDLGGLSIHDD